MDKLFQRFEAHKSDPEEHKWVTFLTHLLWTPQCPDSKVSDWKTSFMQEDQGLK